MPIIDNWFEIEGSVLKKYYGAGKFYYEDDGTPIWYDGPDNIMDNAADVEITQIDNPYGTVPIGVFVTQVYE